MIANLEQFDDEVSPPKHHASFRGLNAKIPKKKKGGHCLQIQHALNVLNKIIDLFALVCFQLSNTHISHVSSIQKALDNSSFSSENLEKKFYSLTSLLTLTFL